MIFVDTGAWIALSDQSDQYHAAARSVYGRLKAERVRLLTTDYVIDETVTRIRYDSGHDLAVRFLDSIEQARKSGVVHLVSIDEALFQTALSLFRQYDSAILSFTDCTSFAVCEQFHIAQVFAFDQHFAMRNLTLLPGG